jgi:hypothetical protein
MITQRSKRENRRHFPKNTENAADRQTDFIISEQVMQDPIPAGYARFTASPRNGLFAPAFVRFFYLPTTKNGD